MASLTTAAPADKQHLSGDDFSGVAHHSDAQRQDDRAAKQKKTEFLRTAEKLKKQIEKLERERTLNSQPRRRSVCADVWGLEECETGLQEERQAEMVALQRQLVKIRCGVKKFQRQLTDVKPTPELIEKLQEIMTEVETSVTSFKENQHLRFEELLKEERSCSQEVSAFERKMEAWSVADAKPPPAPLPPSAKVGVAKALEEELPPEVTALETFLLQTGGRQGGWDPYDHQSFLKVWTKHSGRAAYRKEALLYLPGRTLKDVEQHEGWYLELLLLQEKKKEAIQRWRLDRQQQRLARLQVQDEQEGSARRQRESHAQALQRRAEDDRKEAAARLEEWQERRRRQQEREEERRLVEETQQRRRDKEERRRQQEVKLALDAQLGQRREEEELRALQRAEEEQAASEERRRTAGEVIRRFQERDLHKMESKLQEKQLRGKEEEERQKRLAKLKEKVVVNVSRDPSRLCKPTKGWEERTREIGPTGGGQVLQMFHRAVPSWRQGL